MKKIILVSAIIFLILLVGIYNCDSIIKQNDEIFLIPVKTIDLNVPEPSGLYFDNESKTLWTVSDENSTIYQINSDGSIIKRIKVDGFDLEGIIKLNDSTLVTILERDRIILFIDINGNELKRLELNLPGEPNKGIEGISYNKSNGHIYIINEKNPGLLLEVDTTGEIISKNELSLSTDYSGLSYDNSQNILWIISDEGGSILKCSQDGSLIQKYKINIEQIEGIALDKESSLLYIVSDPLNKLFIFELP